MEERLGQEVDGAGLHGLYGHRDLTITRHKDNRDVNTRPVQFDLKVKSTDPRQHDVEHYDARSVGRLTLQHLQQFGGRSEDIDSQANGHEHARERFAYGYVIVNDENHGPTGFAGTCRSGGLTTVRPQGNHCQVCGAPKAE
jgi:hypothetical protein